MKILIASIKIFKSNFKYFKLSIINLSMIITLLYCFSSLVNNEFLNDIGDLVYIQLAIAMCYIIFMFFCIYFVFNTNLYIFKKQTKELGIYQILGVRKKEIAAVLVIQTAIIYIISSLIGLCMGVVVFRLFLLGFRNISTIKFNISYEISTEAIFTTLSLYFIAISSSLTHSLRKILKLSLLNTLNYSKTKEKSFNFSIIRGAISIILIVGAYIWVYFMNYEYLLFIGIAILLMVIIGTNLFFSSFMPIIFTTFTKNKKFLYKGKNIISIGNLSYKISTNNSTWSMITISIATIITTLSISIALFYNVLVLKGNMLQNIMSIQDDTAMFIGALFAYLGPLMALLFTINLCTTILFRFLNDLSEDEERYKILYKLGVTKNSLKKSLKDQIATIMFVPSLLGIAHAVVATYVIKAIFNFNIFLTVLISIAVFLVLYCIYYYFILYVVNKEMVKILENKNNIG